MKMRRIISPIVVFILAQFAWFALLALWIYWYVRNYMIFIEVGERISPQFVLETKTIAILVGGILLLMALAIALALIFGRLNQQLKVNRMYDSFIASVTHELKSPLASIQLYLETLSTREVPKERRDDFIGLMLKDSRRLNALISSILEIAGIEENKKIYRQQLYDADSLFRDLVSESTDQFNLSTSSVTVTGYVDCMCRVDRRSMSIVVNNLFDNAVKYSEGPPHIEVKIARETNRLILRVTDQGIGIAEKDQRDVFKKFRRIQSADNLSVKGTGLGLYWVREIIRHHRGKISVYSSGPNQGTTFTIELPVIPAGQARRNDRDTVTRFAED
jgi:signal transduction histidine kinase